MTLRDRSILLVEDSPDDEELTLMALSDVGAAGRVRVARDGAQALECLFGTSSAPPMPVPALVLLDLMLPKLDGFEVLEHIQEQLPVRGFPVVILTSSDADNDIVQGYRLGANSYIKKPVDSGAYAEVVSQVASYWLDLNRTVAG